MSSSYEDLMLVQLDLDESEMGLYKEYSFTIKKILEPCVYYSCKLEGTNRLYCFPFLEGNKESFLEAINKIKKNIEERKYMIIKKTLKDNG
jgi:hypothetical protein